MKPETTLILSLSIILAGSISAPAGVAFAQWQHKDFQTDEGCFAHGGPICHEICQDYHAWFWFGHREICIWQPSTNNLPQGKPDPDPEKP